MNFTLVGIDLAKSVFQVHYVDQDTGEEVSRILKRSGFLRYFSERAPCLMGQRRAAFDAGVLVALERLSARLPAMVIVQLQQQFAEVSHVHAQIKGIEVDLKAWYKPNKACQVIGKIPGVGLLTATAAVALLGDAKSFRSGREFAAYVELVPRHTGSGGKLKLLGISKRGDRYLRSLLIHGVRTMWALLAHGRTYVEDAGAGQAT